ncbi:MAG: hypothetical protein HY865_22235 [Chloroflexi bacterium]|nr:hypothetical protein [Chloroflexota bacterium]
MPTTKRQIKVQILLNGEIKFDNSQNPDEARILKELAELAAMLSGDPQAVKIEKHVHQHGHVHSHEDGTIHSHA